MEFGFIPTPAYWIENMKRNPLFHHQTPITPSDTSEKRSAYENLLLNLASNALKRKIVFVSIFEDSVGSPPSEFQPANDPISKTVYYLA